MFNRKLKLNTSQVPTRYSSLRVDGEWRDDIIVDLERVAHHEYVDTRGHTASRLTPYVQTYFQEVAGSRGDYLRFEDGELGHHKEAKTRRRNALGRAICRSIAERHFQIWLFGHVEHALNGEMPHGLAHLRIERAKDNGDAPDYISVQGRRTPVLLEAKGHKRAHGLGTKKWSKWEAQISENVNVKWGGTTVSVKGFVIATRLLEISESPAPSRRHPDARILDPSSPGEELNNEAFPLDVRRATVAYHYASILNCLRLNEIATQVRSGEPNGELFGVELPIWRCTQPPFEDAEFAGFLTPYLGRDPVRQMREWSYSPYSQRLLSRLTGVNWTLFALHKQRVRVLQSIVRYGIAESLQGERLQEPLQTEPIETSDFSVIGDGTVIGSVEHFELTGETIAL
jgi:hypothetical protein